MKILESQSAVLSNYEVYQHLTDQRDRYKQKKHRGPPNLETVVRETAPSPLSQKPLTYTPEAITQIIEKLSPYELSKGEMVMILNLRPASIAALNTIIEDMPERYSDEQQEEIVGIVADVLGQFEVAEAEENGDAGEGEDVNMNDAEAS
ncbi:Calcitonin peptide-receptor component protein [Metarhizium acridum CQMa 102]|uniref:DNA-directed RNA polymerase III subunit RPC9 n=1 Tax=Metarhizium acridum (strain CQMa 102) TaxID=655827 RepID=E9E126_METAQ|nr:Calcitonin peptide-receptor component protein [Metarhizium acridum CQMa 102]EFY90328.1 Calcitonin peptide-receptor component protein [Metarhizium acridum CQMa 102]